MPPIPFAPRAVNRRSTVDDWAAKMEAFHQERLDELTELLTETDDSKVLADGLTQVFSRYIENDTTPRLTAELTENGDVEIDQAESGIQLALRHDGEHWQLVAAPESMTGESDVVGPRTLAAQLISPVWWGDRDRIDEMAEAMAEDLMH